MANAVTVTGGRELIAALDATAETVPDEAAKVVKRGAQNVKTDWRRRWSGHPHIPVLPYAISYSTTSGPTAIEAEIGVDKNKPQGPLGNVVAFGSPTSAPLPGPLEALDTEMPRFESALLAAGVKFLERQ